MGPSSTGKVERELSSIDGALQGRDANLGVLLYAVGVEQLHVLSVLVSALPR